MSWVLNVGIGLLIIPTLLVVIIPIIDAIFNFSFIDFIDGIMEGLNYLIGSNNTNYVFQILAIIMFFLVFKWIIRTVSSFK